MNSMAHRATCFSDAEPAFTKSMAGKRDALHVKGGAR